MTAPSAERHAARRPTIFLLFAFFFLRVLIGWHFLYEGLAKLLDPDWSAAGYLASAEWLFAESFRSLAANEALLGWVDLLNVWALILIGLGLILGIGTRLSSAAGIALLTLYYLAHPPLVGMNPGAAEGSYLIVNKNLIELAALLLLLLAPRRSFGGLGIVLRTLLAKTYRLLRGMNWSGQSAMHRDPEGISRRELIASLATVPVFGGFIYAVLKKHAPQSTEEGVLQVNLTPASVDATTGPSVNLSQGLTLDELQKKVPRAKLGGLEVSRLMLGGNLMNGYAHARDLMYVSSLIKAYHSMDKVMETLWLAEQCGMNALVLNTHAGGRFVEEYRKRAIGEMQFIAQINAVDLMPRAKEAVDYGVKAAYIQAVDLLTKRQAFDEVQEVLEMLRDNGVVAGYGSHELSAIKACVDQGIEPDFCMKTFHHLNYWSAQPGQPENDNRYCEDAEETIEFMKSFDKPWIAFKTLAAGSIHPKDGLRYAFENGADFACIGMYDFQVVENANIVCKVLDAKLKRERPWV